MNSPWLSALKLLRIPFSIYLMPVYWFAVSMAGQTENWRLWAVFLVVHLLVYPASNGYNSWYDRDEGSIGGLKNPPKVGRELIILVLIADALALICSFLISFWFGMGILIYTLISKAYSHPRIRLKKFPVTSTLVVTVFQGFWTFLTIQAGLNPDLFNNWQAGHLIPAIFATGFLLGSYPMTQIYQHVEDHRRGDRTLSLKLGIPGTFLFTRTVLGLTGGLFFIYLWFSGSLVHALTFVIGVLPVLVYFEYWFALVRKDPEQVSYEKTMGMNRISSLCLTAVFLAHWMMNLGKVHL